MRDGEESEPSRERVQTPKARELNMRQLRMESSDTEDTIEVVIRHQQHHSQNAT